jgi:hypothetical protein
MDTFITPKKTYQRVRTLMASIHAHVKRGTLQETHNDIKELHSFESPSMFVSMYLNRLESFRNSGVPNKTDIESLDRLFVLFLRDLQSKDKDLQAAKAKKEPTAVHEARSQALEEKFFQLITSAQNYAHVGRYDRAKSELRRAAIVLPGHSLLESLKKELSDAEDNDTAQRLSMRIDTSFLSSVPAKIHEALSAGKNETAKTILAEALSQDPLNETLLEYRQTIEAAARVLPSGDPEPLHDLKAVSEDHILELLEQIRMELRQDPLNERLQILAYEYENAARKKKNGQHLNSGESGTQQKRA